MRQQNLLLIIFVTILFSLTNQVIVKAEYFALTVVLSDTCGETSCEVVPVKESNTFFVTAAVNFLPEANIEAKPGNAEWHFNGITGMNNTTIGADNANTWTTSNSRSISVPTTTAGKYDLTFSMSLRFPKLNNDGSIIKDENGNQLYYDVDTVTHTLTVWVVGIDSIQYKKSTETNWQDYSSTLYIPKGQTLDFKAIKTPNDAPSFPNNYPKWSGSSGATGNGETKSVTFDTASTIDSDKKEVIVSCDTSTKTAEVIVGDLQSLTLAEKNKNSNNVTSGNTNNSTLYIFQDKKTDSVSMDVTLNCQPSISKFCWKIERNGQAGTEWSTNTGNFGTSNSTTITWTPPTSGEVNREYNVTAWFDENGDSNLSTGETSVSLSVVIAYLEIVFKPEKYPSGFMNPTSSAAYVIQLSDGSAPCKIKAKWLPTTISASKFNWKIEAKTNGGTTSLWSSSSGTFSNIDEYKDTTWNQGTTTSPTRSFVCNVGFDYNKNSQYDTSEKTRSIDVEIVQLGELKLTEIDKNGADVQNVDSVG
ncbi:MAG: hypothetical protein LBC74_02675, partial [Planctomycetaceae bacterium]|nr:hypothetical protein [Planctomycetaceae bacterium]